MKIILVVDDEATIAEMLQTMLDDEGYQVLIAGNGRDGLEQVAARTPDLILCDVMMPIMDGRTMVQMLRGHPAYATIPVIMMSAGGHRVNNNDGSIQAYLNKPFDIEQLLELLRQFIGDP